MEFLGKQVTVVDSASVEGCCLGYSTTITAAFNSLEVVVYEDESDDKWSQHISN
jgi:hypothetical protein